MRRTRPRPIRTPPVANKDLGPLEFQFNISEPDRINDQITTDTGVTQSTVNLQQQELTSDELQQLFSRAGSQLVTESTDEQEFFKRDSSIKPPKTSQVIQTPFPPPAEDRQEDVDVDIEQLKQLATQKAGPLVIERFSPNQTEIDHPLANITITFNQPMIAVSSLDENLNVEDFGISLTPKLEGRWRWAGAKTVRFESKHRLPFSTKFTLQVKKEQCQSAIGGISILMFFLSNIYIFLIIFSGKLEDGLLFEFSTTTPKVVEFVPYGTVSTLKPKVFLLFDQKVDKNQILKHLRIFGNNQQEISNNDLQLLNETEAKNEFKSNIEVNEGNNDRYVAFTFKNDLSKATEYTLRLPAGCPSAEGPLKTTEEWSASFQTYEPLRIVSWQPDAKNEYQKSINPGESWSITFNNSLDRSTVTKSLFNIQPEITNLGIEIAEYNNQYITIHNNSKANTVYTLTIKPELLKDIHGQTLEHDHSKQPIQFHVHDSPPSSGHISGATGI